MRVGIGVLADAPSGLAVATVDAALGLVDAGVEVTLFADAAATLPARAAALGDDVVRLAPLPRGFDRPRVSDMLFLPTKLALARRWAAALRDHPVDVVHAFSPGTAALLPRDQPLAVQAWFHPPRLGARLQTMLQFARRSPLYAAHVLLEAQSHASDVLGYRRADVVLANTRTAERGLRQRGFNSQCVPPMIQVPATVAQRTPSESLRVVYCAHPLERPRKGLSYLLGALARLPAGSVELTLVGGWAGAVPDDVATAQAAGAQIRVLGRVARDDYLALLGSGEVDLLAFPSLYEEWGYALFEALSRGVPALAFDLYPFHDILDADTGMLVAPRSAAALAEGLEAARNSLPDPERVAASTSQRFSSTHVIPSLIDVYSDLDSRGGVRR